MKNFLKWAAGIIFILAALGSLIGGGFLSSIFYLIAGLVCLPPTLAKIDSTNKLKSWHKYAIAIAGLVFGGVFMPDSMKKSDVVNTDNVKIEQPDKVEENKVEYKKIGDVIEVGNFVYRIDGIKFKKSLGNEFTNETADGIFLLISMSIKNISKESRTLNNSMFKLTDSQGAEYESSSRGTTALEMSGSNTLFLKQCQPNITTSGLLVFEVPSKDVYDLKLSGGFWSGKTASVKLTD